MTITISAQDPRSIKALEIAAAAGQWLRCHTPDGRKAYGVPSQCQDGRYYLVDLEHCDCPDFKRSGLSTARLGHSGEHQPCKHVLAVRLVCELAKAQQNAPGAHRPRRSRPAGQQSAPRGHLTVADGDDIFRRFEGD